MALIPQLPTSFHLLAAATTTLLQFPTLLLLLVLAIHSVGAVNVYGFTSRYVACFGQRVFQSCENHPPNRCCGFAGLNVFSVEVEGTDSSEPICEYAIAYQSQQTSWNCSGTPEFIFYDDASCFSLEAEYINSPYPYYYNGGGYLTTPLNIGSGVPTQLKCVPSPHGLSISTIDELNLRSRFNSYNNNVSNCIAPNALMQSNNRSHGKWVLRSTPQRIRELHSELHRLEDINNDVNHEEWIREKGAVYELAKSIIYKPKREPIKVKAGNFNVIKEKEDPKI